MSKLLISAFLFILCALLLHTPLRCVAEEEKKSEEAGAPTEAPPTEKEEPEKEEAEKPKGKTPPKELRIG